RRARPRVRVRQVAQAARGGALALQAVGARHQDLRGAALHRRAASRAGADDLEARAQASAARAARLLVHADGHASSDQAEGDAVARDLWMRGRRSARRGEGVGHADGVQLRAAGGGARRRARRLLGARRGVRGVPSLARGGSGAVPLVRLPGVVPRRLSRGHDARARRRQRARSRVSARDRLARGARRDGGVVDAGETVAGDRMTKFRAKVVPIEGGGHYVVVPEDVAEKAKLTYGVRVRGTVEGTAYRSSLMKYSGVFHMGVHKATLAAAKAKAGDTVAVT